MNAGDPYDVRLLITSYLRRVSGTLLVPHELPDNLDMRVEGLVDSLGFMQLIADLEERLGFQIDFEDLDPAELTLVGPLSRHIAGKRAALRRGPGNAFVDRTE